MSVLNEIYPEFQEKRIRPSALLKKRWKSNLIWKELGSKIRLKVKKVCGYTFSPHFFIFSKTFPSLSACVFRSYYSDTRSPAHRSHSWQFRTFYGIGIEAAVKWFSVICFDEARHVSKVRGMASVCMCVCASTAYGPHIDVPVQSCREKAQLLFGYCPDSNVSKSFKTFRTRKKNNL